MARLLSARRTRRAGADLSPGTPVQDAAVGLRRQVQLAGGKQVGPDAAQGGGTEVGKVRDALREARKLALQAVS